jgi:hypothetical protein
MHAGFVFAAAIALSSVARADDVTTLKPCQLPLHEHVSPRCHRISSAKTPWGRVTLFGAYDRRTLELTPASIRQGDYLAVYSLVLPGLDQPVTFEEGGEPNAHHGEMCDSQSDWCEQIIRSVPTLRVDDAGRVTLNVTTITRVQRWVADYSRRTTHERRTLVHTLRCGHDAIAGWDCSET